jgi:hypothetical protein
MELPIGFAQKGQKIASSGISEPQLVQYILVYYLFYRIIYKVKKETL